MSFSTYSKCHAHKKSEKKLSLRDSYSAYTEFENELKEKDKAYAMAMAMLMACFYDYGRP